MNATRQLHDLGQSLWLDNITRGILNDGTLQNYIEEMSVTGLTSNPTIFDHARLQGEGTASFSESWKDLLERLAAKRTALTQPGRATADRS
jgi:hypothetical protein